MHHKKRLLGAIPIAIFSIVLLMSDKVFAAECIGPDGKTVSTFFDWGCTGSGEQITPLLITILNWASIGVALAVVGGIIYGGIQYSSSGGDQGRTQAAIKQIRNAVLALVLYFGMWALLNWLVPGGLFN
jgi:hypothetical protein